MNLQDVQVKLLDHSNKDELDYKTFNPKKKYKEDLNKETRESVPKEDEEDQEDEEDKKDQEGSTIYSNDYLKSLKKDNKDEHNPTKNYVEFDGKDYKIIPNHLHSENFDPYLRAYDIITKRNITLKKSKSKFKNKCDASKFSIFTELEDSPPNLVGILKFLINKYEFKGTKFIDLPVFFE
jgi:hypothetical protein